MHNLEISESRKQLPTSGGLARSDYGKLERAAAAAHLSRLIVWPDENHRILTGEDSRYWYQKIYTWLKKYLGE